VALVPVKSKKKKKEEKENGSVSSSDADSSDDSESSVPDYVFENLEDMAQQHEDFKHQNRGHIIDSKASISPELSSANGGPNSLSAQDVDSSQSPTRKYAKVLSEARLLDSGVGGELSGEPSEGFVNFMARILPKGYHMDLGCATGVYLVLIKEKRPDLEIAGIEIQRVRCNMARNLHAQAGFKTQISECDILKLEHISEMMTSVFMHDTVWTIDVLEASTKLVLENSSLEIVVTVRERPRLITEGSFVVDQTFEFTLRGGKKHAKALVYKRTRSTNVHQVRKRVVDVTRSSFASDRESYLGDSEVRQKQDMQVRYPFVQYYVTTPNTV
jgi:predicted O-methyltransferase YrrM